MTALLLIYAVGALGTALELCRDEEYALVYRLETMLLWPCYVVVRFIL